MTEFSTNLILFSTDDAASPSYPSRPRVLSHQLENAVGIPRKMSWMEGKLKGRPLTMVVIAVVALVILFLFLFLGGSVLYIVCGALGLCKA